MAVIGQTPHTATPDAASPGEDAELRSAAEELGLVFDDMNEGEHEFLRSYRDGMTASLQGGIDDNPLIPTDDPDDATPEITAPEAGATTDDAVESGSGPSDASSGVGDPPAASPAPLSQVPPVVTPPGLPPLIDIPGVGQLPASEVLQALAQARSITPLEIATLQAIRSGELTPLPPAAVAPPTPAFTPPPQPAVEWEDTAAQAQFAQMQAAFAESQRLLTEQLTAVQQGQQAWQEQQVAERQQAIISSLDKGIEEFRGTYQLSDPEVDRIIQSAAPLIPGLAPTYGNDYPTMARVALESVYWSTPEFRDRAISAAVTAHTTSTREVDEKKDLHGAISSSPGNVARTPLVPAGRNGQVNGMAEMIGADMAQNGQNGN